MSCPYYWYNYHYACRKSGKDVNEDTYDRYCKNYDYDDCPIYKGNDTSGGCFLTSACVEARGLSDDCRELTVLRNFRDTYMKSLPCGMCEIKEYYAIAPLIVEKIKSSPNAKQILDSIYTDLVLPCVKMIDNNELSDAHDAYRAYVEKLRGEYLA